MPDPTGFQRIFEVYDLQAVTESEAVSVMKQAASALNAVSAERDNYRERAERLKAEFEKAQRELHEAKDELRQARADWKHEVDARERLEGPLEFAWFEFERIADHSSTAHEAQEIARAALDVLSSAWTT